MERIYRLLTDTVAGAQTALAQCAQWTRGKSLVCGLLLAAKPHVLRPATVPVRAIQPRRERGFTLVELIVTLVIGSILLGIAVPSFQRFVRVNRINSELSDLATAFNVARSEAARKAAVIRVCARTGDQCSANAADWRNGWLVFHDQNNDAAIDAGEEILHDHVQPYATVIVQLVPNSTTFTYSPAGDVGATKTFYVCDNHESNFGRRVEIASSGRVSVIQEKELVAEADASAGTCTP